MRHPAALALAAAAALSSPAPSAVIAQRAVPHEIVVKRAGEAARVVRVPDPSRAIARLRARPGVRYAVPNVRAHAAGAFMPNDPGETAHVGGRTQLQWNFAGPFGVGAPAAWGHAIDAGAPGGAGVTIAVLDTGVAYKDRKGFRRSADLARRQFVPGHDFVDGDRYPFDVNGHGTHVTSTIAERTSNGFGLTGLAYRARIMPVRVLDSTGSGSAAAIASGLRFAARHGAKVINLSFNFTVRQRAQREGRVARARDRRGLAVGATTENGRMASFANHGAGLDLVAPGGGSDADLPGDAGCVAGRAGRSIDQVTLVARRPDRFGIPLDFIGTSMATPHVAATAALVIADGTAGRNPSPDAVAARLERPARDRSMRRRCRNR